MILHNRIQAFVKLRIYLQDLAEKIDINSNLEQSQKLSKEENALIRAQHENRWFTSDNIQFALKNWSEALTKENIEKWISNYTFPENKPKTIAVIMAGNIPLVGFHDFLSVLISGNKVLAKLSSNDKRLLPLISKFLIAENSEFKDLIEFTDGKLKDFDAVIATGSNNTSRYFDYYFKDYPHIIRKNRNSVAVLSGKETVQELELLMNDIFRYFGLGCRSVSKIYIPKNYDFKNFFKAAFLWKRIIHNHKYMNNYDYNKAIYLMSNIPLLNNEFLLLKKDESFSSPIAVLYYEEYDSKEKLHQKLNANSENIQCIVSNSNIPGEIPFGQTQRPELWEYADGIDTLDFLLSLK